MIATLILTFQFYGYRNHRTLSAWLDPFLEKYQIILLASMLNFLVPWLHVWYLWQNPTLVEISNINNAISLGLVTILKYVNVFWTFCSFKSNMNKTLPGVVGESEISKIRPAWSSGRMYILLPETNQLRDAFHDDQHPFGLCFIRVFEKYCWNLVIVRDSYLWFRFSFEASQCYHYYSESGPELNHLRVYYRNITFLLYNTLTMHYCGNF